MNNHSLRTDRTLLTIAMLAVLGARSLAALPCDPGGRGRVLVVERQAAVGQIPEYAVGEGTTYSIRCAPANAHILWFSTQNGAPTGEDHADYGQLTDGNGYWSAAGGAWAATNLGHWTKTASIEGIDLTVAFDVTPSLMVDGAIDSISLPTYTIGQAPTYTVTGAPPNAPIYWSSTRNGNDTGEDFLSYGQTTDGAGNWSTTGGAWSAGMEGRWVKTASFGSPSSAAPHASMIFQVISSCDLFPAAGGAAAANSFSAHVGTYDWPINRCLIDDGANKLAAIGGHVIHLLFNARCNPQESLVDVLNAPEYQAVFNNPYLTTYVLTVVDRTACADNARSYIDPGLDFSGVVADYKSLAMQLYSRYHGTGKTFILSNWEGDNVVYCGAAYGYATDQNFHDACDANYPVLYKGIADRDAGMNGFIAWLKARQQGVQQGRDASAGSTDGVQVAYAVEFNIVNALQNQGLRNVLSEVQLQGIPHDFLSYSAYESTNISAAQLQTDLQSRNIDPATLIIGEFGYSERDSSPQCVRRRTDDVINTALALGVPYIFNWALFDNAEFGIYDFAGQGHSLSSYFETRLPGNSYQPESCP
ncbi:MAG: hypothetical protein M3O15_01795 [Acidobacteriota bacterium]|nr:hypothetical protein [Acidobacteriota bacterium]